MSGQISLLNAINEKETHQPKVMERQSLPKSSNSFALLMAGNHAAHHDSHTKATTKASNNHHVEKSDKKADMANDKEKEDKDVKSASKRKALDDVMPQLSKKDTPLKVTKDVATETSKDPVSSSEDSKGVESVASTDGSGSVNTGEKQDSDNISDVKVAADSSDITGDTQTDDTLTTVTGSQPGENSGMQKGTDLSVSTDVSASTTQSEVDGSVANDTAATAGVTPSTAGNNLAEAEGATAATPHSSTTNSQTNSATQAPVRGAPSDDAKQNPTIESAAKADAKSVETENEATSSALVSGKQGGDIHDGTVAKQDTASDATNTDKNTDTKTGAQQQTTASDQVVLSNISPDSQQDTGDVDTSSTAANNSAINASNNTVATSKAQSDAAAQFNGARTVASNANAAPASTNVGTTNANSTASDSTGSNTGSSSAQTGQKSGSGQQSFSGQGNPSSPNSFMNQVFNSQLQMQQSAMQQAAVKQFNDLSMKADANADTSKLLGSLGLDSKAQLPASMQGIAYSLRSPQWNQALGQRVVYMATNKVQEAKITLNPEKLGPVQIKLHLDKNQQLHVSMSAHHHMTKDTMEAAVPKLREMLDSAGVDLGSIDVNQDSQFAASQQDNNEQDNESGGTFNQSMSADQTGQEEVQPVTIRQTDSLIDYYA